MKRYLAKRRRVEHRSPSSQSSARNEPAPSSGQEQVVQLRPVNPPTEGESEDGIDADIDIIAIHGLDTKSPDTWIWKDPKNPDKPGVNWLEDKDMLPKLVGRARIVTCDWPADLYETSDLIQKTIEEFARLLLNSINGRVRENRPTLFIASCLGGIILMKALDMATGEYSSIKTATRGVIFLATPFRGTAFEDVAQWAEPLLETWASFQNKKVTRLLHQTKPTFDLDELVRGFTQLCKEQHYEISTFYEMGTTDLFRRTPCILKFLRKPPKLLVDRYSATLDIVAHPLPLDRCHTLMNKFQGPNKDSDKDYKKVAETIENMLETIREGTPLEQADSWVRDKHYTDKRLEIRRLLGESLPMDQCYINLAIVKQLGEDTQISEGRSASSPFSLSSRLKIEMPEEELRFELPTLFDPCKMPDGHMKAPRRILIRGRAGVGKTTLCKKIVHDFTQGNIWRNSFKRVLWVPLRNLKSKKPRSFQELFYHEYFIRHSEGEDRARELSRALSQALDTKGERTLFVLDGLDEVRNLGDEHDNEYIFFSELLNQPDVIITTRPHAILPSGTGQPDLELETIGFYPDQVQHYLKKVVQDPPIVQSIRSFLKKHWLLQNLVRIPIQLDALCLAWDDIRKKPVPETMTAVYEAIVFHLWKKDIVRLREKKNPNEYYGASQSWEIERDSKPENELLECFAFSGMCSNMVEFQPEHQGAVHKLVKPDQMDYPYHERLGRLSFLRSSDPSADASIRSYHFLHLTFQEFFAAQYFVKQWGSGEDLVYLDLHPKEPKVSRISPVDFLKQNKYDSRYDVVWRFTTGLLDPEKGVPAFFKQLEERPLDLLGPTHPRLVMHCLSEMKTSSNLSLRRRLEKTLSQWLLFECGLHGNIPSLVAESEFPDQALQAALEVACDDKKEKILRKLINNDRYLSENTIEYVAALLENADLDIQRIAVEVLKKRSNLSNEAVTKLMKLLQNEDANYNSRHVAAITLQELDELPEETVTTLLALFQDVNGPAPELAAQALKNRPDLIEGTIKNLLTVLRDMENDVGVQSRTKDTIGSILIRNSNLLEDSITTLVTLLKSSSQRTRLIASDILGNLSNISERTATALAMLIKDEDEIQIKDIAIEALSNRSNLPEEAITALIQLLGSTDWSIQYEVASILERQSSLSKETHTALKALLDDADVRIQSLAAKALRVQSSLSEQTITALVQLLENTNDRTIRRLAVKTLRKQSNLSEQNITTLIAQIQNEDMEIRNDAVRILSDRQGLPEQATTTLLQLLENENENIDIRCAAGSALMGQSNLPDHAITTLIALVRNENWDSEIQGRAADILAAQSNPSEMVVMTLITLGDIGFMPMLEKLPNLSKEAVRALGVLLEDERESVRFAAAAALKGQSNLSQETITAIIALLEKDTGKNFNVIRVLGSLPKLQRETVLVLMALVEDSDWDTRRRTLRTIGEEPIFDKILEALTSSTVESKTMKLLYWSLLYRNFRKQFCLYINEDSSLCIERPNGSWSVFLRNCNSPQETLDEVLKWRKFWNFPDLEVY